ncbi:MAG: alkaline phosphatase D family protein [Bradymonadia bacterium]
MSALRRRDVLKGAAGLALAACGESGGSSSETRDAAVDFGPSQDALPDAEPPAPDPFDLPVDAVAFPLGVQAGSAEAAQALFWTYTQAPRVTLRVWPADLPPGGPPVFEQALDPVDGFVKVLAVGLSAGAWHRYAFFDDAAGTRSLDGRLRAALPEGARAVVRIGATACTAIGRAPFTPLPRLAERELDALCHLGDMSYNDGSVTREEYRADWARMLSNAEYRALLPTTGSYITWDDHEIADGADLEDLPDAQVATAKAAFFENLPVLRREGDRFWASYRWGATVEFFVLDVRHERTDAEIMSEAQLTWLLGALDASPCHFKVILTSVPIANLPPLWAANAESWMRFTAQRDRLLDHLVAGAHRNVLFLAGDYHVSAVWRVEDTGPRAAYHEVLCGPAGSGPSNRFALARSSDSAWQSFFPEGRIDYALDVWTATFLTFDPEADTVRVELLAGDDGRVLYDAMLRHEA